MKINLSEIDDENFFLKAGYIADEECFLIQPNHIGCKWSKNTLHFRSSIWNSNGELVSASFKKFFNWNEQPDLTYTPFSTTANGGIKVLEKKDGSTLIVSKYKGELIMRTRGTFDASQMEKNGHEIAELLVLYPQLRAVPENESWLFEWISPLNKIVINYGLDFPEIYLLNVIRHEDYLMYTQHEVDELAFSQGFLRPKYFHYDSIKEMLNDVVTWEDKEGVCVYCNKDQDIRKLKSEWYLTLHKMKSELASFEKVVDFYFANGCQSYNDTYAIIAKTLDFEIAEQAQGDLSRICDGMKEVWKIVASMKDIVDNKISTLPSRKLQAQEILQKWGETNRASFAFCMLDGKELTHDQYKKLLYQVTKK